MKNLQKLPTLLSISRIPLSIGMIFTPAFSIPFFVLYTLAGATDALDGFLARKLNACTKTGAIIDSIADIVFFVISLIKIFTAITIPFWLWICMAVIVFIRLVNIIIGFITQKKLVLLHTIANKITGGLIFLFPYSLTFADVKYAAIPICTMAFFAAGYENTVILRKAIPNKYYF